jgi:hypothetical protein
MIQLVLPRISNCTVTVNDNVSTCFSLCQSVNSCHANVNVNYSETRLMLQSEIPGEMTYLYMFVFLCEVALCVLCLLYASASKNDNL